jgi:Flp pilus assembly protein TadG
MKSRQSGVALVEFALILPFLLVLTLITTELGRALYQYNIISKSVRNAVRYLSMQAPGTNIDQAKNLVVFGNLSGTGSALAIGLSKSLVPDPVWSTAGTGPVINTVTIKVSGYRFTPLFTSVFDINLGVMNFSDIGATMRSPS